MWENQSTWRMTCSKATKHNQMKEKANLTECNIMEQR